MTTQQHLTWNERLALLRRRLGLDQTAMAERLGITREWISKLETGSRQVSELIQLKIEQAEKENLVHTETVVVGQGDTEEAKEFSWRLQTAIREHGTITRSELAARMGISLDRLIAFVEGKIRPRAREGRDLARLLGVQESWLMRGEGEKQMQEEAVPYGIQVRTVPVISWAHAGAAATYEEMPRHFHGQVASTSRDKRAFGLIVEGDSMQPKWSAGDIVIVEPLGVLRNGKPCVAKFANDAVQLRIYHLMPGGKIRLAPMNPVYPAIEHTLDEFNWLWPVCQTIRNE